MDHAHARMAALSCLLCTFFGSSCQGEGGLLVPDRGVIPRADARVRGHEGKMVMIPYAGEPVMLTLDASQSRDPDGRIAKFRWLSGTREKPAAAAGAPAPAAGSGGPAAPRPRIVPEDAQLNWPDDIEQPQVTLDRGSYAFTLWVTDDRGLVSAPDTLRIEVGSLSYRP